MLGTMELETAGLVGGLGADAAVGAMTGGYSAADMAPAAAGGVAALAIGLLSTPITGALVASYAPRQPLKGAILAVGLSFGLSLLGAAVVSAGVTSSMKGA